MRLSLTRSVIAFGLSCLALTAGSGVQAQGSSTGLTADLKCNNALCLQVIYSASERMYNMTMTTSGGGAPLGWRAVGTGSRMAGSNMMIGWVNSDGSVTMSQRTTSSGHNDPTTSIQAQAAIQNSANTFSNSSGTSWSWSFPLSSSDPTPSSRTSFIWATNQRNSPSSSSSNANIREHTDYGQILLDLTKAYTLPSSGSSGSTTVTTPDTVAPGSDAQDPSLMMNKYNRMIIAHMVFMILGWLVLAPAAVLLGRWGRTVSPSWFKHHRNIQFVAAIAVVIGFVVIVIETSWHEGGHFESKHAKVGLAIFIILFAQIALGAFGHRTQRFHALRIIHVVLGLIVIAASFWNTLEGLELWPYNTRNWPKYVIIAWIAVVAVAYLAGLVMLPKDVRQWKASKQNKLGGPSMIALNDASVMGTKTSSNDGHQDGGYTDGYQAGYQSGYGGGAASQQGYRAA